MALQEFTAPPSQGLGPQVFPSGFSGSFTSPNTGPVFDPWTQAPGLGAAGAPAAGSNNIDLTGLSDPFGTNTGLTTGPALGPQQTQDLTGLGAAPFSTNGASDPTVATGGGGAAPDPSSIGSALGGLGTDIGSLISSVANSGIGTFATYAGLYSLLANKAGQAGQQNTNLARSISDIGAPDVAAGQGLLKQQQAGQLANPYALEVSNAQAENAKAATSQMQQVSQLLANAGGGNVQSAMASEGQQITSQEALANSQAVVGAFNQELSDSLALTGAGGAYVQNGIMQEIQSNTQLQGQLSDLMGMLANAYAKQMAGAAGGTGAGGKAGGPGGIISSLGKVGGGLSNLWNKLTNSNPSGTPSNAGSDALGPTGIDALLASAGAPVDLAAPDIAPVGDITFGELGPSVDAAGNLVAPAENAISAATDVASTVSDVSGGGFSDALSAFDDSIGSFSSAGGQAAADSGAAIASDAASTASSALSGTGGGLGVGAGLGDVLGIAGAVENPANPSADINAALDAASLYGHTGAAGSAAIGGLAAEVAPYAGFATTAAAIASGIVDANQRGPPLTFAPAPGLKQGKLPSGNSVATVGNVGIGEGNNEAQGSGQLYRLGPDGTYHWLGQSATNEAITASNYAQPEPAGHSGNPVLDAIASVESTNYTNAATSIFNSLYSSTGGQGEWGESEAQWQQALSELFSAARSNGGLGLNVGKG